MAVVNEREIFEQKPWLNDDLQNVNRLTEIVSGGSGSSDFSTATVTVNGSTTIRGSLIYDDGEKICSVGMAVVSSSSSVTLILYKGVGFITVDGIVESASGSVEFDPDISSDACYVTGDCSITVVSPI